jgi:hypothetical protein
LSVPLPTSPTPFYTVPATAAYQVSIYGYCNTSPNTNGQLNIIITWQDVDSIKSTICSFLILSGKVQNFSQTLTLEAVTGSSISYYSTSMSTGISPAGAVIYLTAVPL